MSLITLRLGLSGGGAAYYSNIVGARVGQDVQSGRALHPDLNVAPAVYNSIMTRLIASSSNLSSVSNLVETLDPNIFLFLSLNFIRTNNFWNKITKSIKRKAIEIEHLEENKFLKYFHFRICRKKKRKRERTSV